MSELRPGWTGAMLAACLLGAAACQAGQAARGADWPPAGDTAASRGIQAPQDPWAEVQLDVPSPEDKPLPRGARAPAAGGGESSAVGATGVAGGPGRPWLRSSLALGGVVALIVLLAWGYRTVAGGGFALSGRVRRPGLIEVISRTSLSPRQALCLVRVGPRLVLVGVSGDRLTRLDGIDDPDLTARLVGESQRARGDSHAARFQNVLEHEAALYEVDDGETPPADTAPSDVAAPAHGSARGNVAAPGARAAGGDGEARWTRIQHELMQTIARTRSRMRASA